MKMIVKNLNKSSKIKKNDVQFLKQYLKKGISSIKDITKIISNITKEFLVLLLMSISIWNGFVHKWTGFGKQCL